MVRLTTDQIQDLSCKQSNIRNISIIGQIGHGKTLLSNYLSNLTGIIVNDSTDTDRLPIDLINLDSTTTTATTTNELNHYSLYYEEQLDSTSNPKYYINLIDTPGHIELSSKVSAAVRITDGSLFVVDVMDGIGFLNESILRLSLLENNKPILFINKMDSLFGNESSSFEEEIYSSLEELIEKYNQVCLTYSKFMVGPINGNVVFGSAILGFAFTLDDFATLYSNKFGLSKQLLVKYLWGNNYYDPILRKFVTSPVSSGGQLKRGFCEFILQPISQLYTAIMKRDLEKLKMMVGKLNISITDEQLEQFQGLELARLIFSKFIPAEKSILSTIVSQSPTPLISQSCRVNSLYQGPMDDSFANSISLCNSSGPLVMYVSALIPNKDKPCQFYALGRIFSGALKRQDQNKQMKKSNDGNPSDNEEVPYLVFSNKSDVYVKRIKNKLVFKINNGNIIVNSCGAGNIVCIEGLDQFISKSCTVSISKQVKLRDIKISNKPVFGRKVETKYPKDVNILMEALKLLDKYDLAVSIVYEYTGEIFVYGSGQYHLDCLLGFLENFIQILSVSKGKTVEIKVSSTPIVPHRESINQESSRVCETRSPNKLNKIHCTAEPLPIDLSCKLESGHFDPHNCTSKEISNKLCDQYGWDSLACKNIWAFGLDDLGSNVLVNSSNQNLQEIKEHAISGFNWVIQEGAICDEKMWGVRFDIREVLLQKPMINIGSPSFIPTTRRVLYASQLSASPILLEPIYNTQINIQHSKADDLYNLIKEKRGTIIQEYQNTQSLKVKVQLPVIETLDFGIKLKSLSQESFHQNIFSHWLGIGIVREDNFATNVALQIRKRKGINPVIPSYSDYTK